MAKKPIPSKIEIPGVGRYVLCAVRIDTTGVAGLPMTMTLIAEGQSIGVKNVD
jgi:hypothetical protein